MINEVKLNKLLNKMGTVCNPISALRPDSVDELAKKYKKKDYEQLIHLAFNMYSCIQEANTAIRDVLNQSLQNDGSKGTVLIIEEIKRNRAKVKDILELSKSRLSRFQMHVYRVFKRANSAKRAFTFCVRAIFISNARLSRFAILRIAFQTR